MKNAIVGSIIQFRGNNWRILEINITWDGYRIALAQMLDDDGNRLYDENHSPIIHDFFLG